MDGLDDASPFQWFGDFSFKMVRKCSCSRVCPTISRRAKSARLGNPISLVELGWWYTTKVTAKTLRIAKWKPIASDTFAKVSKTT